jgi:hypothetical protein
MRTSLVALAFLALAGSARAQDKQACVGAYEKAQQLRADTKLRAAREQLLVCSRPECPALIRQDCSQWVGEVQNAIPSVVVAGRDASGHDVLAVRVSIDGAVVAESLDGKPIQIDPGPHKFRYESAGRPPIEEQVLVREGERNRQITVNFARPEDRRRDEPPPLDTPPDKPGPPIVAFSLIGLGVVALGAALYFDLKANGDARNLRDSCAPKCQQSDVDAVQAKYVAAGVALGVGIVGLGVGAVLLLARPSAKTTASTWRFDVTPTRGGASALVGATF